MSIAKQILESKSLIFRDFEEGTILTVINDFILYDIISGEQISLVEDDMLLVKDFKYGTYLLSLLDQEFNTSMTMQVLARKIHEAVKHGFLKDTAYE